MGHLRFNISSEESTSVIEVTGDVDLANAADLLEAIELVHACSPRDVTLDLAGVTFIDARGLATLVLAHRHLVEHRCRLHLRNAHAEVASVLRLADVPDHLAEVREIGA